ncbi:MAG: hypothetical protein HY674_02890 [Chloroflexi bacterium]|nr:hypothetical protein [Chloroflexota bacterium]
MSLKTATAAFRVDARGSLAAINGNGRNYVAAGHSSPLLQVRVDGKWHAPNNATWKIGRLTLRYDAAGVTVALKVVETKTHVTFEVLDAQPTEMVELVWWGPYPTTIGDIIGEVVGVARDREFAIGIQALNAKTLGGAPGAENDIGIDYTAHDDPGRYADFPTELNKGSGYRGNTAWPTPFGSVLQAYCRNRDRDRVIANWGHEKYLAPAFHDGGVVGSKIALFACPAALALATIGEIEIAAGLPHPMLDGVWGKVAPRANESYLIVDFGEHNIEQAIAMTQAAGLRYLYHSSPFETWGHFRLKPNLFPNGWDGLRTCVEKARRVGVRLGVHTLSNFITPNDPYVTPKPDRRLARVGASALAADLDAGAKEIPVESPEYFQKKTDMNTVAVGDELIRYDSVSGEAPSRLLGCRRGAWGTTAAAHRRDAAVGRLMDHGYKVFLTDALLSQEVARNLAKLCNHAGLREVGMDGLEGNWSTGHGQYGRVLFTEAWYEALVPELRGQVRRSSSNPAHFTWHVTTFQNWGEPWYAGFRQSQTLYRFKNQLFFERNLLPPMLGWFSLRPDTTLADAEWLLARAAGYDAGFALATSIHSTAQLTAADASPQTKNVAAILEAVKQWETARLAGAFPGEVKALLRDNQREFHLEPAGTGQWDLYPIESGRRGAAVRIKTKAIQP